MLKTASSNTSLCSLDFDFFDATGKITDTQLLLDTDPSSCDNQAHHLVHIGHSTLRLARDPLLGTGGLVWPAGQVLAQYLVSRPHLLHGRRVLEVGSGTGIVGLSIAANVHLASMTCTDLPAVLPILHTNAKLNYTSCGEVAIRPLVWGDIVDMEQDGQENDVYLLADVVYLESLFQPLVDTMLQLMKRREQVAYLCYKKRRRADARFFKLLKRHFTVEALQVDKSVAQSGIQLFQFRRKHDLVQQIA